MYRLFFTRQYFYQRFFRIEYFSYKIYSSPETYGTALIFISCVTVHAIIIDTCVVLISEPFGQLALQVVSPMSKYCRVLST